MEHQEQTHISTGSPVIKTAIATSVACFAVFAGLVYFLRTDIVALLTASHTPTTTTPLESSLFPTERTVVDMVKDTNPAVVAITISKEVPTYETTYQNIPSPFQDFFGDGSQFQQFFQVPTTKQNGTKKEDVGGGSGFIITSDGLIVTNRHVVEDTKAQYSVTLTTGKKYTAKVLARDPVLDIAVVKIDAVGLPSLSLGDSDTLALGQSVVAIGNALGQFKNSVSLGVVSGLSRSLTAGDSNGSSEELDHVIQTDAAINPGNSGGPLLDLHGTVVGVNVAIAQGSENIGFALPINTIKSVIESVKTTGKIVRPYLGIRYIDITPDLKDKNKLTVDTGALVQGNGKDELAVIPGSPADKAGIVENDIIESVDGVALDDTHNLSTIIRDKKVGDVVTLKVLSKGTEKTVTVTLEEAK